MSVERELRTLADTPRQVPDIQTLLTRAERRRLRRSWVRGGTLAAVLLLGVGALFTLNLSSENVPITVVETPPSTTMQLDNPGSGSAPRSDEQGDPRFDVECPQVDLSAGPFRPADTRQESITAREMSPIERLHSAWEAPGEEGVITVALPGSTPIGDGFHLVETLRIGEFEATLAPNVHHSPDPWRLMVFLPFDDPGCGWMTVMAWEGAGRDELRRFAEALEIQIPDRP